ncbi:iron complex transport system substrate-binding protein [Halomicrobium zhouii]|uniref:Iron complex transport system substrate-binding protein n=1 Tax=Halomicrobium zhouii TaxID=767519 RepID=A0A1I6MAQ1_9EURY|nr:ABC transporter substrate-binding protein [Halomicrobium zhouii]SFS12688.1 iron complex transport system substrate-binding protein [Halomicrobium zhouii]
MSDDRASATRRDAIRYGGAIVGGGLLAGCAGAGESSEPTDSEAPSTAESTATDALSETATAESATETTTAARGPYSVTIQPAGQVTFPEVPETWVAENASWADMGVALGLDKPSAVVLTGEYRTWHYEDIPGLSTAKDGTTSLWQDGISKELLYDIDADVHFVDPNYMINLIPDWDRADVDEIAANVGPFCGNTSFSTYPWHGDYPYYSLNEATEKVAQVFGRTDRYRALRDLRDETTTRIRERLPLEDERPEVALVSPGSTEPEKYYPYRLGDTTAYEHWHTLGVSDAFAGSDVQSFTSDRGSIDYEALLEIDPEVLLFYTDQYRTESEFEDTYRAYLREHSSASQLSAVQNGAVYPAGGMYQGPISNLSKTERAARQLFPDEFGDERLYDRQRVADIRNGDL